MQKLITPYASNFGHAKGRASKPNITIKHFPDTESYVQIPQIKKLKNKAVLLSHSLYPEPDKRIFELLLILSRLKEAKARVELFIPYLPYARQDRENKLGEAISADVLCELLKNFGVKKLITYDCHFLPKYGNFTRNGLNIENKTASRLLYLYAKKYFKKEKFLIISPDQGASYFTEHAEGHTLHKKRKASVATGNNTEIYAHIHKIESDIDVDGKNICILDDMISTGSTMMKTIEHLKEKGAKKVIVGATHGIFAGVDIAQKIIDSSCDHIFTTNSITREPDTKVTILKLPKD